MQNNQSVNFFENRELSWLSFNRRVLEEACCEQTPLMERLRFVQIFMSNLDEFYMIRVGSLYDQLLVPGIRGDSRTGMTVQEQLDEILKRTAVLMQQCDDVFQSVRDALREQRIEHLRMEEIADSDRKYLAKIFRRDILPLLSPQIIDKRHPFPHINSKQLYIAVHLQKLAKGKKEQEVKVEASPEAKTCFGLVLLHAPAKRLILLPAEEGIRFVLVEDLIRYFVDQVFTDYKVLDRCVFSITRNADLSEEEALYDEDVDYRDYMKDLLKKRRRLAPVRMEFNSQPDKELDRYLQKRMKLKPEQVFLVHAPLTINYFSELEATIPKEKRKKLFFDPIRPAYPLSVTRGESMIRQALRKDMLISCPYESIDPFLSLIHEAAQDPYVISIQITLYRVGRNSSLINHLISAVENGKDVTVVMELRARFDEQRNIDWAIRLEAAGCRVIYGLDGYKVHSKLCLITRRERELQYITQVGTGNYNETTARQYTDLMLLTSNTSIGLDAVEVFHNLSIGKLDGAYSVLLVSPVSLKPRILALIDREIYKARRGIDAAICLKCNGVTDREILEKLVEASKAGVKVNMIVRGILCLRPGIPGVTDNITVVSVVGRFLEHSRIYSFGVDSSDRRTYIASADLMTRNTENRVEIACPVLDPELEQRVRWMLSTQLKDNVKARVQLSDGGYAQRQPEAGEPAIDSQIFFLRKAQQRRADLDANPSIERQSKSRLLRWMKRFGRKADDKDEI